MFKVMYMGTATYPAANEKFDGYHYNAASNRQSVRQTAPRGGMRQTPTPAPPSILPSLPHHIVGVSNTTQFKPNEPSLKRSDIGSN